MLESVVAGKRGVADMVSGAAAPTNTSPPKLFARSQCPTQSLTRAFSHFGHWGARRGNVFVVSVALFIGSSLALLLGLLCLQYQQDDD